MVWDCLCMKHHQPNLQGLLLSRKYNVSQTINVCHKALSVCPKNDTSFKTQRYKSKKSNSISLTSETAWVGWNTWGKFGKEDSALGGPRSPGWQRGGWGSQALRRTGAGADVWASHGKHKPKKIRLWEVASDARKPAHDDHTKGKALPVSFWIVGDGGMVKRYNSKEGNEKHSSFVGPWMHFNCGVSMKCLYEGIQTYGDSHRNSKSPEIIIIRYANRTCKFRSSGHSGRRRNNSTS